MGSEAGGGQGGLGNGRVSSSHIKKSMETGESSFNIFYLTQLYLKYHFNIQSVYIVLIKYITISSPQHLGSDELHGICSIDTWPRGHHIRQDRLCTLAASVLGGRSVCKEGPEGTSDHDK